MSSKSKLIKLAPLLAIILFLVWLLVGTTDSEAFGNKCDQFEEGFNDGYCSQQTYGCITPGWFPLCIDSDYQSERQAYHVGYTKGERKYASDFPNR